MNLRLKNNRSFTLIELVIVLSIFVIIASAAISAFVDIANKAFGVQEDATMRSLQSAALLYFSRNDRWWGTISTEDPFTLLENPPPHSLTGPFTLNVDWVVVFVPSAYDPVLWWIQCPHFVSGTRGKIWSFYPVGARAEIAYDYKH